MFKLTSAVAFYGGSPVPIFSATLPGWINYPEDLDIDVVAAEVSKSIGGHPLANARVFHSGPIYDSANPDVVLAPERIAFLAQGVQILWTKQDA